MNFKSKILIIAFLVQAVALIAAERKSGILFTVTNPVAVSRTMEIVSVNLSGVYLSYPEWKNEMLTVFVAKEELISQTIDNDQDGISDELLFQASFKPNETRQFELYRKPASSVNPNRIVDVRFVLPRHDLAWENDRIAFRMYGSVLAGNVNNGIDVWTKRVRYQIIEKWYHGEEQTPKIVYHEDHGEGADFFSVGRSLGAGSSGLVINGKLIQPGLFAFHRIIANGPIRVLFELIYPDMMIDTMRTHVVKRISLDAGQQLNKITDSYTAKIPLDSVTIALGLVKRMNTSLHRNPDARRLSLWGLTTSDSTNGFLGTGILAMGPQTRQTEDSVHHGIIDSFSSSNSYTYYSGAAWSRMGDITTEKQWIEYLDAALHRLQNPLLVTFNQKKNKSYE